MQTNLSEKEKVLNPVLQTVKLRNLYSCLVAQQMPTTSKDQN